MDQLAQDAQIVADGRAEACRNASSIEEAIDALLHQDSLQKVFSLGENLYVPDSAETPTPQDVQELESAIKQGFQELGIALFASVKVCQKYRQESHDLSELQIQGHAVLEVYGAVRAYSNAFQQASFVATNVASNLTVRLAMLVDIQAAKVVREATKLLDMIIDNHNQWLATMDRGVAKQAGISISPYKRSTIS